MTGQPARRLASEEIAALKRAVHTLHDNAFSTGCELRAHGHEEHSDA
jgi:hypothetical protein